jgi:hypothetical protein
MKSDRLVALVQEFGRKHAEEFTEAAFIHGSNLIRLGLACLGMTERTGWKAVSGSYIPTFAFLTHISQNLSLLPR